MRTKYLLFCFLIVLEVAADSSTAKFQYFLLFNFLNKYHDCKGMFNQPHTDSSLHFISNFQFKESRIERKIFWTIPGITKETIGSFANKQKIKSAAFEIWIGSIKTTWYVGLNIVMKQQVITFFCFFRRLTFQPNGNKEKDKSHLSIFLKLIDASSQDFSAVFSLNLLKNDLKKYGERSFFKSLTLEVLKKGHGHSQVIEHQKLFEMTDDLITDGNIKFLCEVS